MCRREGNLPMNGPRTPLSRLRPHTQDLSLRRSLHIRETKSNSGTFLARSQNRVPAAAGLCSSRNQQTVFQCDQTLATGSGLAFASVGYVANCLGENGAVSCRGLRTVSGEVIVGVRVAALSAKGLICGGVEHAADQVRGAGSVREARFEARQAVICSVGDSRAAAQVDQMAGKIAD